MVWMSPHEPIPVPRPGCRSQRPGKDGCCYPTPVFDRYVVVGPGGYATQGFVSAIVRYGNKPPPPPPPPPPAPPPWVPASWAPSYAMNDSVSLYWRNASGLEPAQYYDGMGLVILDWAHAAQHWINDYQPMDNGAALAAQCAAIKARSPRTRCLVYRNTAIALNQFAEVRVVLEDEAYAGFFLHFKEGATQTGRCRAVYDPRGKQAPDHDPIWPTDAVCDVELPTDVHVPMCDRAEPTKCQRRLYFDQNQCPQVPGANWANDTQDVYQGLACRGKSCNCGANPCGEYLFDFRNASLVEWYLGHGYMGGALEHPSVDGLILDDFWSGGRPSEIDAHSIEDMGLTPADVAQIQGQYEATLARLLDLIAAREKMLAGGRNCGYNGDSMSGQTPAQCTAKLRQMCGDAPQHGHWYVVDYNYLPPPAYGVAAKNAVLDVAYFLLTRAPHAWIAGGPMLGWHMSHWWAANRERRIQFRSDLRPALFNQDFGEPSQGANCTERSPGVFTRQWTKASVTVDCNTLEGTITAQ